MLRRGEWDGVQIFPSDWVDVSASVTTPVSEMIPETRLGGEDLAYGMMWWVWDGPGAVGAFEGAYTSAGAFGQYITVLPALDMVVAHKTAVGGVFGWGRETGHFEYLTLLDKLAAASLVPVTSAH